MKYCNLNCKHLHSSIIERCGEGIGYEYRCMAQKGMPIVTIDTYCPYDELSETKQETSIDVKELKQELELYKKALELTCYEISASSCDDTEWLIDFYLQKAREEK